MVRILCNDCNKLIKGRVRLCRSCKLPVCFSCSKHGYCRSCHPSNSDHHLINEYFKDKYAKAFNQELITKGVME